MTNNDSNAQTVPSFVIFAITRPDLTFTVDGVTQYQKTLQINDMYTRGLLNESAVEAGKVLDTGLRWWIGPRLADGQASWLVEEQHDGTLFVYVNQPEGVDLTPPADTRTTNLDTLTDVARDAQTAALALTQRAIDQLIPGSVTHLSESLDQLQRQIEAVLPVVNTNTIVRIGNRNLAVDLRDYATERRDQSIVRAAINAYSAAITYANAVIDLIETSIAGFRG